MIFTFENRVLEKLFSDFVFRQFGNVYITGVSLKKPPPHKKPPPVQVHARAKGGGFLRDDFAEGENFEDLGIKSSISLMKIVFLKCKTAKFSACGGLETLKTL